MHSGSEVVTRADEILTAVRVKILPSRDVKFGCESSILWFEKLKFRPKSRVAAGSLEFLPHAVSEQVGVLKSLLPRNFSSKLLCG